MAHLAIHNIGPIKEIDIDLNRFNVFIGPQSSGKSTIAKIVSFCQWLEKDCIIRQQSSHIDKDFVKKNLIDYHNISEYIKDNSTFLYEGKYLHIRFSEESLQVESTMEFKEARVSKNAYIPAERTVISVPGIFSTKMPKNYLASFLDDWQQIRTKFENGDKVDILNLGDAYFFDAGANADMLTMKDGRNLHLSQASSGLQSVTPLCVFIAYITAWIYSHPEDKSSDERKRIWDSAVARSLYEDVEMPLDDVYDQTAPLSKQMIESFRRLSDNFLQLIDMGPVGDEKLDSVNKKIKRWSEILATPSFSNIVIEEPELNLFPETQATLVYFILTKIDHKRDNMVITTHSPYILYAINNCILANLVKEQLGEEDWEELDIPQSARLDGKDISVWELRDGYIINNDGDKNKTIQDNDGLIRGNYFDRVMHNIMADFNNLMNYK